MHTPASKAGAHSCAHGQALLLPRSGAREGVAPGAGTVGAASGGALTQSSPSRMQPPCRASQTSLASRRAPPSATSLCHALGPTWPSPSASTTSAPVPLGSLPAACPTAGACPELISTGLYKHGVRELSAVACGKQYKSEIGRA